jgi:uncharacterized protein (DUF1499 family)
MPRGLVFVFIITIGLFSCSGRSAGLGVKNGELSPCPQSPNCVSSQSKDEKHYIEPLHYDVPMREARETILTVIRSMKRTKMAILMDDYIRAEFVSSLFRFVDDVEFYFNDASKTIHIRSASRVGYSDLGVNRKRIEQIRAVYNALTGLKE